MEAPYQPAFEKRPEPINTLGMAITANPFLVGVYDYLVLEPALLKMRVQVAFVRHHLWFGGDNCVDLLSNGPTVCGGNVFRMNTASLPFDHAEDWFFIILRALAALVILAADVCFVGFDRALKQTLNAIGHRLTNAMVQVPSSFVGHAHVALHLLRGDALLSVAHDRYSQHPFT